MIGTILLGVWLIPAIVAIPVILLILIWDEGSLFPFDHWYDPIFLIGTVLWPIFVVGIAYEYRMKRLKKLSEVQKAIHIHYQDKWYE